MRECDHKPPLGQAIAETSIVTIANIAESVEPFNRNIMVVDLLLLLKATIGSLTRKGYMFSDFTDQF